jgi:hypothetical protein
MQKLEVIHSYLKNLNSTILLSTVFLLLTDSGDS